MKIRFLPALVVLGAAAAATAGGPITIELTEPDMDDPGTLMQALSARASSRSFSTEPVPDEVLSGLLWAAFGINRPATGRRTAPSAMNMQEIDIYVATASGLYLFDAASMALVPVSDDDIRGATGFQDFTAVAPLNLVFVADYDRMGSDGWNMTDEDRLFLSACDTGFICQNVYLFCALNGLSTVVRAAIDKPALEAAMGLRPAQHVVLAQTVGYPGEDE